ncbi:MAG: DUF523 domain-containing protein [Candidatus Magasanikbacteria bacterium]|nr:DUF523 domain-containing protein [Candidatus Magasanikbacteria bacterium]MBT4071265.1 DUF523 domain-containing protein [Candidatus Magasanikbacteria bacterium]
MKLCSACLLGVNCRYSGDTKPNKKVIALLKKETLIPVCPEQLGGLATPRDPSQIKDGRVFAIDGTDVTDAFKKGAEETLKIAKMYGITEAILKQRSPSCGYGKVYDGTFSKTVTKGIGVTAALLEEQGIRIQTEEDL